MPQNIVSTARPYMSYGSHQAEQKCQTESTYLEENSSAGHHSKSYRQAPPHHIPQPYTADHAQSRVAPAADMHLQIPLTQNEKRPRAIEQLQWDGSAPSPGAPSQGAPFVGNLPKELFIFCVSLFLNREADNNSKHATLPTYSEPESVFFSVSKPEIPTQDYVRRLVTYTQCSPSAFVVMLIYLRRIALAKQRLFITPFNMHRLLVTSLTLACKMLDDRCFANVHYAKVGGIPTSREMNRLELQFLDYMGYRLHVEVDEYLAQLQSLESFYPPSSLIPSPICVQAFDGRAAVEYKDGGGSCVSGSSETCFSSERSSAVTTDGSTYSNRVERGHGSKGKGVRQNVHSGGKRTRKEVRGGPTASGRNLHGNFSDFSKVA